MANGGVDTATFTVSVIVNRAPVLNGANSPLAVRNSRRLVREAHDLDEPAAWARGRELAAEVLASPDALEGARAFTEKRAPVWQTT